MSLRAALLVAVSFPLTVAAAPKRVRAGDLYEVKAAPATAAVGAKGKASVVLTGKNGWHLNEQAPVKLTVTAPAGVTIEKAKLGRKDLAEDTKDRARFDVPFTATEAGKKTIDAEASFVICQEQACKPVKEKVSLAVDIVAGKK